MKKLILVLFLITGLLAGAVGTAPAETVVYQVGAVLTGLAPNVTEDEEFIVYIHAISLDGMWTDTMGFVASGPGSKEVLDTALSANSIGAPIYILTDDVYFEDGFMPIIQIYSTMKPVEDDDVTDTESFERKLSPEIMEDVGDLSNILNQFCH